MLLVLGLFSFISFAQEDITSQLKKAYAQEQYDAIIAQHSEKVNDYPAKAIYYVAMAYYMKANDTKVLELMDLSLKKDKTDPDAYFIKGMTFNFMGQSEKAVEAITHAISLDDTNTHYYSGLGDALVAKQQYNKALEAFIEATEKENPSDRAFAMIPQIYTELNQPEKALEAFYRSKENVDKASQSYSNALYNIGVYEYLNEDYNKSEVALVELIKIAPEGFQSYAKLIQAYYGKKEYDKAKPLKEQLYAAYHKGILKGNLSKMFCYDQFKWKKRVVLAFERFAVKEGELYYKHVFYVTNDEGVAEFTIQTENSPISVELGGPKYVVGMDKDGAHYTFQYGFEEDFKYEDLKEVVLQILDEKIKPGASSKPGK